MSQEPYFHDESGAVRFWVDVGDSLVGASVSKETLHYRYQSHSSNDDPMVTFAAHLPELQAAVRRRVAAGSIEPVMLRGHDLVQAPGI